MKYVSILALAGVATLSSGCATKHVAAWERGNLAKPQMLRYTGAHYAGTEAHTYHSKEATRGGFGVGGGGCGCN